MEFVDDNVRTPDKSFSECLIPTPSVPDFEDVELQKVIQASIEFEESLRLKKIERKKKEDRIQDLMKQLNILRQCDKREENIFFIQCIQNSIDNYMDGKTDSILLFELYYLQLIELLNGYYTEKVKRAQKPKITEETYVFFTNNIKII